MAAPRPSPVAILSAPLLLLLHPQVPAAVIPVRRAADSTAATPTPTPPPPPPGGDEENLYSAENEQALEDYYDQQQQGDYAGDGDGGTQELDEYEYDSAEDVQDPDYDELKIAGEQEAGIAH